jgi:hypothetical protein
VFIVHTIPVLYLTIALWSYVPDPKDDNGMKFIPLFLRNLSWILYTWFTVFQILETCFLKKLLQIVEAKNRSE